MQTDGNRIPLINLRHRTEFSGAFYFGEARHGPGDLIQVLHVHSGVELGVITSGKAEFRFAQAEYRLSEGDCYFLDSMIPHMHGATAESGFTSLWLHIKDLRPLIAPGGRDGDTRLLQPFLELRSGRSPALPRDGRCAHLLAEAANAFSSGQPCADLMAWGNILLALTHIAAVTRAGAKPDGDAADTPAGRIVRTAIAYMHSAAGAHPSLKQIAAHCCVSPSRLSAIFSEAMHVSPIAYLNQVRIHGAAERLATSSDKLSVIADEAGFQSLSQFHRLFKRITRRTPASFRSRR